MSAEIQFAVPSNGSCARAAWSVHIDPHAGAVDEQHALAEPGGADIGEIVDHGFDRCVRLRRDELRDDAVSVSSDSASEWCSFTSSPAARPCGRAPAARRGGRCRGTGVGSSGRASALSSSRLAFVVPRASVRLGDCPAVRLSVSHSRQMLRVPAVAGCAPRRAGCGSDRRSPRSASTPAVPASSAASKVASATSLRRGRAGVGRHDRRSDHRGGRNLLRVAVRLDARRLVADRQRPVGVVLDLHRARQVVVLVLLRLAGRRCAR